MTCRPDAFQPLIRPSISPSADKRHVVVLGTSLRPFATAFGHVFADSLGRLFRHFFEQSQRCGIPQHLAVRFNRSGRPSLIKRIVSPPANFMSTWSYVAVAIGHVDPPEVHALQARISGRRDGLSRLRRFDDDHRHFDRGDFDLQLSAGRGPAVPGASGCSGPTRSTTTVPSTVSPASACGRGNTPANAV